MSSQAIGIDLGTTSSCVGVYQNGKVKILTDSHGNSRIPSYVAFTQTQKLVGEQAKILAIKNPFNTIFNAKRLIGKTYNDPTVQADMRYWPFRIINDDGKPKIQVEYKYETKIFTPEQISSMILTKLKQIAESYL
ncbi:unnamed protein product, partial [Didymodactylos carnosus]